MASPRWTRLAPGLLFLAALALRLWFNLSVHRPFDFLVSDMWVYDHRAQDLLNQQLGPWDTFTPPGFPALLATLYSETDESRPQLIAIALALFGALVVPLTIAIGRRVLSLRLALLAGALVAFYLPLVYYGGFVLTEVPFATLSLASLWLSLRSVGTDMRSVDIDRPGVETDRRSVQQTERRGVRDAALAGLALAAAATVRANALLILPISLALPWLFGQLSRRQRLVRAAATLAAAIPLLALVSAHNSRLLGRRAGLATNGGLNFFLAHTHYRGASYREGDFVHHITPIRNDLYYRRDFVSPVPFYDEGYFYAKGLQAIAGRPSLMVDALNNVPELFGVGRQSYWPEWPGHEPLMRRWSQGFFYALLLPTLLWLLWALIRRRLAPVEQLLALVLASTVLAGYLYLGDPRLRVPFDPLFVILTLQACAQASAAVRRRASARAAIVAAAPPAPADAA